MSGVDFTSTSGAPRQDVTLLIYDLLESMKVVEAAMRIEPMNKFTGSYDREEA